MAYIPSNALAEAPKRERKYQVRHTQLAREKIQAHRLIDRLQAFATNQPDKATGKAVEMSNAQVRAALGLLSKVMPDLKESDIHHHVEPTKPSTMIAQLQSMLGNEQAQAILERIGFRNQAQTAQDAELVCTNDNGSISNVDRDDA